MATNYTSLNNKFMCILKDRDILAYEFLPSIKDVMFPEDGKVETTYTTPGGECSFIWKLLYACRDKKKYKKRVLQSTTVKDISYDRTRAHHIEGLLLEARDRGFDLWAPMRNCWSTWDGDKLKLDSGMESPKELLQPYYPSVINMAIEAGFKEVLLATLNDTKRPPWGDLVSGNQVCLAADFNKAMLGCDISKEVVTRNRNTFVYTSEFITGVARLATECRWAIPYFLKAGMPIDIKDKFGNTMLHYAPYKTVKWLTVNGASISERNHAGQTFLEAKIMNDGQAVFEKARAEGMKNIHAYVGLLLKHNEQAAASDALLSYTREKALYPAQTDVIGRRMLADKHKHFLVSAALKNDTILAALSSMHSLESSDASDKMSDKKIQDDIVRHLINTNAHETIPEDIWWALRACHSMNTSDIIAPLVARPDECESLAMISKYAKRMSRVYKEIPEHNAKISGEFHRKLGMNITKPKYAMPFLWDRKAMMGLHDTTAWKATVACCAIESLADRDEGGFDKAVGNLVFKAHGVRYMGPNNDGNEDSDLPSVQYGKNVGLDGTFEDLLQTRTLTDPDWSWALKVNSVLPILVVALDVKYSESWRSDIEKGNADKLIAIMADKMAANGDYKKEAPKAWALISSRLKDVDSPILGDIERAEQIAKRAERMRSASKQVIGIGVSRRRTSRSTPAL